MDELPDIMRTASLKAWCEHRNIKMPSKIDIAYRILDAAPVPPLVDESRMGALRAMYEKIASTIGGNVHSNVRPAASDGSGLPKTNLSRAHGDR